MKTVETNGKHQVLDDDELRYRADPLHLYLKDIARIKLLTPEEEVRLAARIKAGDAKARETMIVANLRLVVKIARDYDNLGLQLLDLINEGNIGLMKGVERFDPNKGAKLSTYAVWWIKQGIKRALANQGKTIRLPVHVVDKISHLRRAEHALIEEFGRAPTDEELAERLGVSEGYVKRTQRAAQAPCSIHAPISSSDDSESFEDVIPDPNCRLPSEELADSTLQSQALGLLDRLSERERFILRKRFGLDGGKESTLEEVAEPLGLTRERVRQIQNIALKKLQTMLRKSDRTLPENIPNGSICRWPRKRKYFRVDT